ncbi:MAG: HDIG domain-containing protein [Bacteroidaceae bacterium]|nr:HDIG domain-containing protein [Bacteroidaceae bacterium]
MSSINTPNRMSFKSIMRRALIYLAAVALIVYFLPRDVRFIYQFDLNKPWRYGQLMATFDFPIYKPNQVIQREQDSIIRHFQPYFSMDVNVGTDAINQLRADYQSDLKEVLPSSDYLRYIINTLGVIYRQGILDVGSSDRLQRDSTANIRIINGMMAEQQSVAETYTIKDAYTYLLNSDSARYKPEILQKCALNAYLAPNLIYEKELTETARQEAIDNFPWAMGMVQSGQKIVDRGEIISENTYNILKSLEKEMQTRSDVSHSQRRLMLGGQVLFVALYIFLLMLYLGIYRKDYFDGWRDLLLIFSFMVFFCLFTSLLMSRNMFSVYIIPYAILPMVLRTFLDSRTALLAHIVTILICSITLRYPHEFILIQVAAGIIAIFNMRELSRRSQLFLSAFLVVVVSIVIFFAYEFFTEEDISKIDFSIPVYIILNGILLLFTYPLFFIIEKTFGYTSNVTLVELSDVNNNLLRHLSETAPGTFQHSMQVANLATEAANFLGANAQLVRTGALYHDIGKTENPAFFTENQLGGVNPHENLSYEQSAKVVINHVTDGLKLAEKNNLPTIVKDFISTHHGKGKTKYFYISWKNEHPNEEPDEEMFTYPGPNPFTKEQAILMMADAVEAASRSLPEYTEESIGNLVDKIIDSQVTEGYFKDCPITFKEIAQVKSTFKEKLTTIYHTRISYPELKK